MLTRQTLPREWLMTDERMGDSLWDALQRPEPGSGVVFRHHASERRPVAERVAEICRRRGLALGVARNVELARLVGADFVHNPPGSSEGLPVSRSVHTLADAERSADFVFVSPVFATASHPGASALGLEAASEYATAAGMPAIAMGGMDRDRGQQAIRAGFHGWAAIDAWLTRCD